jgi:hypothetical protein
VLSKCKHSFFAFIIVYLIFIFHSYHIYLFYRLQEACEHWGCFNFSVSPMGNAENCPLSNQVGCETKTVFGPLHYGNIDTMAMTVLDGILSLFSLFFFLSFLLSFPLLSFLSCLRFLSFLYSSYGMWPRLFSFYS